MQGLVNLGNTCYINTLVQCIGHVDSLREWVLARSESAEFTKELQHILKLIWAEEKSLLPRRFVTNMQKIFELDYGEQHDLCEVMLRVLDRISFEDTTDLVSIEDHANVRGMGQGGPMDVLYKMAVMSWKQYHPRGFRTFDAVVEGLQVHQVQCMECKRCYHNFEPFMILNVDLMKATHLQDAIQQAFGTEELQEWSCDYCKKVQHAEKTVRVWQFPQVITIVLKRFAMLEDKGQFHKVQAPIHIPYVIDFDQESTIRGVGGMETKFQLRSMGLHHGSMNSGHYTCVAQHKNKWIHYDDMNIAEVQDMDSFCRENSLAYVLIYERVPVV